MRGLGVLEPGRDMLVMASYQLWRHISYGNILVISELLRRARRALAEPGRELKQKYQSLQNGRIITTDQYASASTRALNHMPRECRAPSQNRAFLAASFRRQC